MNYQPLSSSKRDIEQNSDMDKFEAGLTKENEALYLQNKVNCEQTMKMILMMFPVSQEEVNFYLTQLVDEGEEFTINGFQKKLIFNLFYKYFGDITSIKAINRDDYIKLMIIAKRILQSNHMIILPYVISSKVMKLITRKTINKKENDRLQASPFYVLFQNKYKNPKMEEDLFADLATILASNFRMIDSENKDVNGVILEVIPEIICEEILMYGNMI